MLTPSLRQTGSTSRSTYPIPHCAGKACKKHTPHKVTQYKKGKDSLAAQGKRRYDRKQSGYGGQTKPVFHKKAKTTKKVVLRLECTSCKAKHQISLKRCKHFELGGDKKQRDTLLVSLKSIIKIGRHPDNDLVLDHASISAFHARLAAVRTSTTLSLVSLTDTSRHGVHVNDAHITSANRPTVGTKQVQCHTVVLREGDAIRFADCNAVFTYSHNVKHAQDNHVQTPVRNGLRLPFRRRVFALGKAWNVVDYALGHGTFGVVNLASHADAPWLQVACKTVRVPANDNAAGARTRSKLHREVKLLQSLDHLNITRMLDVFDDPANESVHMVLELVTGGDLFAYLEKHGALCEPEVQWIAYQLVSALSHLHQQDIAHRDIKTENVLVHIAAAYPRILLGDFGYAIALYNILEAIPLSTTAQLHRAGTAAGTMQYVPPERLKAWLRPQSVRSFGECLSPARRRAHAARSWLDEDIKGDIWALGVVLYMTGQGVHPYEQFHDIPRATTVSSTTSKDGWAEFWQSRGEGTLGGRVNHCLDEWTRSEAERFYANIKGKSRQWLAQDWIGLWSAQDSDRLENLYERIVRRGDVMRPHVADANRARAGMSMTRRAPSNLDHSVMPSIEEDIETGTFTDLVGSYPSSMHDFSEDSIEVDTLPTSARSLSLAGKSDIDSEPGSDIDADGETDDDGPATDICGEASGMISEVGSVATGQSSGSSASAVPGARGKGVTYGRKR
ncbi:40s ribosomal protein L44e [Cryptotrichosporon argae]